VEWDKVVWREGGVKERGVGRSEVRERGEGRVSGVRKSEVRWTEGMWLGTKLRGGHTVENNNNINDNTLDWLSNYNTTI
jgi:hypothetical protein